MQYKAVFLDFYGTLVDEDDAIIDRIAQLIATESRRGCTAADVLRSWRFAELCQGSFGTSFRSQRDLERDSLQELLDHYHVPREAVGLSQELYEYWRTPQACPNAGGFIDALKVPACVVSNIDDDDLASALRHHSWHFSAVVTSQQCRAYKPRPEPFRAAMEKMGVTPPQVLHIGDSLRADVQGAQSLGIDTVWINRKNRSLPVGAQAPTHVVPHIGQAIQFLL